MRANEFFKAMGYKSVKQFIENDNIRTKEMNNDLKRLVESWELVELWGGLEDAKLYSFDHCKDKPESAGYKLMMAIRDVESCQ